MKRLPLSVLFVCLVATTLSLFAAETKEDPYAWKSMFNGKDLDGWKVPVYGGDGEVEVKDGCLVIGQGAMITGIRYDNVFPRIDYEIRYEAKRTKGGDFFAALTFPYDDSFCTFINGGWGGGTVGLSCVDGYDASENTTSTYYDFGDETWYKFRAYVTGKSIRIWVDEEKDGKRKETLLIDLPTADHKISLRSETSDYKPLGICTWCSEGVLRDIEYRKLRPEEIDTTPLPYEIVYTGESSRQIERYAKDGRIVWNYPAEIARDVFVLPNGNILFCFNDHYDAKKHDNVSGVREVTPGSKIAFEYKTTGQVFSCQRLKDGSTLIGNASQGKLLIVDSSGKLLKEITVQNAPGHSCLRQVRVCRNGDFLAAEESAKKVRRYTADGKLVREIALPYTPFGMIELENGNLIISGKEGIQEIDPKDAVVWEFKASDFPGLGVRWCTGMELLKNGNILLVNAGGKIRLFEIARTPTPTIVWQVDPNRVQLPSGHGVACP